MIVPLACEVSFNLHLSRRFQRTKQKSMKSEASWKMNDERDVNLTPGITLGNLLQPGDHSL